jgi:TPP-dependent pyruvate/acetoin dehydrogenase alpha subunit
VGDLVKINPARYAVRKYEENSVKKDLMENKIVGYNIPQIEIDGQTYLMLQNSDIEFVVTEYEEETPYSGLITEKKSLIIP